MIFALKQLQIFKVFESTVKGLPHLLFPKFNLLILSFEVIRTISISQLH